MRARVGISVAAMVLPLLTLSGTAVTALEGTLDRFGDTADEAIEEALPLARLQTLVIQVERSGLSAVLHPTPVTRAGYQTARQEMREAFDALRDTELTEEGKLVATASDSAENAVGLLDQALARSASTIRPFPAAGPQLAAVESNVEDAVQALGEAERLASADIVAEYEDAQDVQRRALLWIVAVVFVGLVLAAAGGLHLTRVVLTPLGALREAARRLGEGTLTHRVALPRRDEFGELGQAFNAMAVDLERSQQELTHHALHDALTGLPNRVLLADRIRQAVARSARRGTQVALLLIDLDGFKAVNDTLGHSAGDELLRSVAERLGLCLRPEDTAARLGGDEFAVLVEGETTTQVLGIGERILRSIRPSFNYGDRELFLTASVGIAFATPGPDGTSENLLRHADLAMYRAKNGGKDDLCIFDPIMHDVVEDRLAMSNELRGALDRGELSLHYQPIYGIKGEPLVAVEALMRWNHPVRGAVPPVEFIPVAEASGLIVTLGAWALDEACRQLRQWQDTPDTGTAGQLQVSVNLSARQLADDDLPHLVAQTLARHDIAPHRLILEITESMMINDVEAAIRRLRELKDL
ncbi:putative bifunctional diguanylate cyclase/phosphodiesterase, partial [Modestobacter marinus]|uniref:putative bifunctional diguanylate cyclase/phosphodiesterase n=1 Tax=Modestobacter marinus TaxID=477641 RepID=UPI0031E972D4